MMMKTDGGIITPTFSLKYTGVKVSADLFSLSINLPGNTLTDANNNIFLKDKNNLNYI